MNEQHEILKQVKLFARLTDADYDFIASMITEKSYAQGETVTEEGAEGFCFYVIAEGEVDVLLEKDGREIRVNTLGPGDYFGEISVLRHQKRTATVRARTPIRLYVIEEEDFLRLVKSYNRIYLEVNHVMDNRLTETLGRKDKEQFEKQTTLVAVYSPQARLGRSMFCANLGRYLSGTMGKEVVLLDMDRYFPDLHTWVRVPAPDYYGGEALDGTFIDRTSLTAAEKLRYLGIRDRLGAPKFGKEELGTLIETLATRADFVIVDAGAQVDEVTRELLCRADDIFLMIAPTPNSLRHARALFDWMKNELDCNPQRVELTMSLVKPHDFNIRDFHQAMGMSEPSYVIQEFEELLNEQDEREDFEVDQADSPYRRKIAEIVRSQWGLVKTEEEKKRGFNLMNLFFKQN
jgi:CRP-like cAMP-binding protein